MKSGVITELGERQSGFIKQVKVKDDLFFHAEALVGVKFAELKKGDSVTFTIEESKKGPYAIEVRRV